MKIKNIILKKKILKNKNVYLTQNFVYFFIEKLFFILIDLLNLKNLCKIFLFSFVFIKQEKFKIFSKDYIILNLNINYLITNKNNIFDLILYSKNVKGYFKLNKKFLINIHLNTYIFFKFSIIF